ALINKNIDDLRVIRASLFSVKASLETHKKNKETAERVKNLEQITQYVNNLGLNDANARIDSLRNMGLTSKNSDAQELWQTVCNAQHEFNRSLGEARDFCRDKIKNKKDVSEKQFKNIKRDFLKLKLKTEENTQSLHTALDKLEKNEEIKEIIH